MFLVFPSSDGRPREKIQGFYVEINATYSLLRNQKINNIQFMQDF